MHYREYKHYWLVRVNLIDLKVEIFNSYKRFSEVQAQDHIIRSFLEEVLPFNGRIIVERATMKYKTGTHCFWNTCKDLICLAGFRSTSVLRRGGETGFSTDLLVLRQDKEWGKRPSERIGHLVYELVVQQNRYLIRRLFGKEPTFEG